MIFTSPLNHAFPPPLTHIPPTPPPFLPPLTPSLYVQVAILRLLKQLGEVYSTIKISNLAAMVPFATFGEVEAIIVDAVRYDYLQVRELARCHKM